jgi:hypothetical protein
MQVLSMFVQGRCRQAKIGRIPFIRRPLVDSCSDLMPEHAGQRYRQELHAGNQIRMAEAGARDSHQHLIGPWLVFAWFYYGSPVPLSIVSS